MSDLKAQFEGAFEDSRNFDPSGSASNEEQLNLYALRKIGLNETPDKPGMFDLKRKAMYKAWEEKKATGISQADAQKQYVESVDKLANKIGYKSGYSSKRK